MSEYRIVFLDHADEVSGEETATHPSDAEAINAARGLLAAHPATDYPLVEVWLSGRRLARITSASLMDSPPETLPPTTSSDPLRPRSVR